MLFEALVAATGAAGTALALRACWFEPRSLGVTRARLDLPAWPGDRPALRVALIADPQAAGPHDTPARLARVVARCNAERPDLVLMLGDYVDDRWLRTSTVAPAVMAEVFARLEAPLGVFAVLGNHDWEVGGAVVRAALEAVGILVLENQSHRLDHGEHALWLAGVGDRFSGTDDLDATLAGIDDDRPVLVLTHSPDLFPDVPARVALTVAGHTHGGQVRLPLIGAPLVPSIHGQRYLSGHVVEDGRHLFVSRGIGQSHLPIRLGAPPEIALLTLGGGTPRSAALQRGPLPHPDPNRPGRPILSNLTARHRPPD